VASVAVAETSSVMIYAYRPLMSHPHRASLILSRPLPHSPPLPLPSAVLATITKYPLPPLPTINFTYFPRWAFVDTSTTPKTNTLICDSPAKTTQTSGHFASLLLVLHVRPCILDNFTLINIQPVSPAKCKVLSTLWNKPNLPEHKHASKWPLARKASF